MGTSAIDRNIPRQQWRPPYPRSWQPFCYAPCLRGNLSAPAADLDRLRTDRIALLASLQDSLQDRSDAKHAKNDVELQILPKREREATAVRRYILIFRGY